MKAQFARIQNRAKGISRRSLAVVLCFVMLLTAVGTGTMLSTFAEANAPSDVANAAQKGFEIANAIDFDFDQADGSSALNTIRNAIDSAPVSDATENGDAVVDTLKAAIDRTSASVETNTASQNDDNEKNAAPKKKKADLAESGWNLEFNSRIYLDAHNFFGSADGSNIKEYVYFVVQYNSNKNAAIIKMDHIANTQTYTCYVDSSKCWEQTNVNCVYFFTTDASGWQTKVYTYDSGVYDHIKGNLGGGKISLDYGLNITSNYVYYFYLDKDGTTNGTLTVSAKSDSFALPNTVNGELRGGQQKASVYVSTDGTTYSYATSGSVGGDVQVGGYGWNDAFTTTSKLFADSSKTNSSSSNYYSYFDTPAFTSWITMKVNEVYDGWYFMGWYDSSGTQLTADTTYYYRVLTGSAVDIRARFFKPTYDTTGTPASESFRPSGSLVVYLGDQKVSAGWLWGTNDGGHALAFSSGANPSTNHIYYSGTDSHITTSYCSNAIFTDGDGNSPFNNKTYQSREVPAYTGGSTTGIYYVRVDSSDNWSAFTHLGITLSGNPATANPGDEITISATTSGTLKSGATIKYYFKKSGDANWYVINGGTTDTSVKFYPPTYGSYTFKATITDSAGLETAVATSATTTNVGQVGYYVSGDAALNGSGWGVAPYTGFMTAPASGTIYTKTFGNVAAGTHEFRITSLEDYITDSSTHGTYTVNGAAGSMNGNNFTFTTTEKQQITITYDKDNHNVTVTTADVQALDVVVYAGVGGFVEVTYGTAVTDIAEGESATIKVAYGDKIDLEASSKGGFTFSKWYKNLENKYVPDGKDGDDPTDINSLEDEVITTRTVYVASFTSGSGSWIYSADRSAANPEISGEASGKYILYSGVDSGVGTGSGTPNGNVTTTQSSSDYWADLTSIFSNNSNPTRLYIALADGTSNSNILGNKSEEINGTYYTENNGPTVTDTDGNTLFKVRIKHRDDIRPAANYIELDAIDWDSLTALGVRAYYTGSGKVNYKFYYKLAAEGAVGTDYIPSTNFYAKDGTITGRDQGYANLWFTGNTLDKSVYTTVTASEGEVEIQDDHKEFTQDGKTYNELWVSGKAVKGSRITVTTTIPGGEGTTNVNYVDRSGNTGTCKPRDKYYVKGFSFNGYTPETFEWRADGVYTCTYTIPANMKESMLEITPIYFIRDEYATNTVMVYINGYSDLIKNSGWGNSLFLYPFYKYTGATYAGQAENFGRYPGQPVVNNGGQLYMQIPLNDDGSSNGKDNNGGAIKGITINNGYNDIVHSSYCKHVNAHRQTYDYDDFAKIYNEKNTKNGEKYLHSIYFSFKYYPESDNQHRSHATTSTIDEDGDATRWNDLLSSPNILNNNTDGTVASATLVAAGNTSTGWEDLTDALGNKVDLFGNKIVNSEAEPLRVFSLGYEYNNAGRWATEWAVYHKNGDNYELVYNSSYPMEGGSSTPKDKNKATNSSIVPSALVMNDAASFANYPAIDNDASMEDYEGLYTALTAYAGIPVKICYEHEIPDARGTKSYRSDGRWTYTTVNDYVKSNIIIEYTDKTGANHFYNPASPTTSPDTFTETNKGTVTGCKA